MVWNMCCLILIGFAINRAVDASVLTAMIYTAGLSQAVYLGGQAAVDAFVRSALARSEVK